ncbi:MAG: GntR family transcriptional regulator [Acidobacteria bacterium]|nr:GntR family transcriptional regulator [Acidobacteriota bacterium]
MIITIDEQNPVPIFRQIVRQVKMRVVSGELVGGSPVPSIRDLAVRLSINPNTVGKAFRELEKEGIIVMKRGVGAFITKNPPEEFMKGFGNTVIDGKIQDLVQTARSLNVPKKTVMKKIDIAYNGGKDEQ